MSTRGNFLLHLPHLSWLLLGAFDCEFVVLSTVELLFGVVMLLLVAVVLLLLLLLFANILTLASGM